jgi:hypothetical protein
MMFKQVVDCFEIGAPPVMRPTVRVALEARRWWADQ